MDRPGLIVSVGLIYYSIVYSGYLSFFDWGRRPAADEPRRLRQLRRRLHRPGVLDGDPQHGDLLRRRVRRASRRRRDVRGRPPLEGVPRERLQGHHRDPGRRRPPRRSPPAHIQVWQSNGTVNAILESIGLGALAQSWIGQSTTSLLVVILVGGCWGGSIGFGFILYYGGAMTQIDPEMLEAGRVDGAGNIRILFSLVLPNVRPITISLAILNLITRSSSSTTSGSSRRAARRTRRSSSAR